MGRCKTHLPQASKPSQKVLKHALEELDSWREYILLKLPIYDDFGRFVTWRATFQRADETAGATYLLKMTCPSTELAYVLRVPPNVGSAREAAAWVNWGTDPEQFAIAT
jgi:hypothetical protein